MAISPSFTVSACQGQQLQQLYHHVHMHNTWTGQPWTLPRVYDHALCVVVYSRQQRPRVFLSDVNKYISMYGAAVNLRPSVDVHPCILFLQVSN